MGRLTVTDIPRLRVEAPPLVGTGAAYASSDMFKSTNCNNYPPGKPIHHLFSHESCDFQGSALKRSACQVFETPKIPLGVGRPTAEFYPWESITIEQSDPSNDIAEPIKTRVARRGGTYDLAASLNYSHGSGSQPLLRFITEHVEIVHNPPYRDWATCLSPGSTSAIETALRIFCNRGDTILTERFTYTGIIAAARLCGVQISGVDMDSGGLLPEHLSQILCDWDEARGPRPTVLYMIPSGQNPTGSTQSLERKRAIYQIAEEYDLLIIEDDPYYYLPTCPPINTDSAQYRYPTPPPDNNSPTTNPTPFSYPSYLTRLPTSYLSLDTSGRVLRLDSTSKILSPGVRCGWITAVSSTISKFISYHDITSVSVAGPTQLMLYTLLDVAWGHTGFFAWLERLALLYQKRLDVVLGACERYLPKEKCGWVRPWGGMFLWVGVDLPVPQAESQLDETVSTVSHDTVDWGGEMEERISSLALENGVQVTKGSLFDTGSSMEGRVYFRLTYAAATVEELDEGVKGFANAVREALSLPMVG